MLSTKKISQEQNKVCVKKWMWAVAFETFLPLCYISVFIPLYSLYSGDKPIFNISAYHYTPPYSVSGDVEEAIWKMQKYYDLCLKILPRAFVFTGTSKVFACPFLQAFIVQWLVGGTQLPLLKTKLTFFSPSSAAQLNSLHCHVCLHNSFEFYFSLRIFSRLLLPVLTITCRMNCSGHKRGQLRKTKILFYCGFYLIVPGLLFSFSILTRAIYGTTAVETFCLEFVLSHFIQPSNSTTKLYVFSFVLWRYYVQVTT